ncbi:MAG: tetratricopeptide repeat protein [Nitrospirota bacterium]
MGVIIGLLLNKAKRGSLRTLFTTEDDRAIAELTSVTKLSPDTADVYLSLGNLFREKGDLSRATRIHQSIITMPSVGRGLKIRAMMELGLDYKKAGLFDRAIKTFTELIALDPKRLDAYIELERLYEEEKSWDKAIEVQEEIQRLRKTRRGNVIAHLHTELGKMLTELGNTEKAVVAFKKAIEFDRSCTDAYLHLGDLYLSDEKTHDAINVWKEVIKNQPSFAFLTYPRLEKAFSSIEDRETIGGNNEMEGIYKGVIEERPEDIRTLIALGEHYTEKGRFEDAIKIFKRVIEINPKYLDAHRRLGELYFDMDLKEDALMQYRDLLHIFTIGYLPYHCRQCGYESREIYWKCPQCKEWDTFVFE